MKKILALILALAMVAVLCACASSAPTATTESVVEEPAEEAEEPAEEAEAAEEPAEEPAEETAEIGEFTTLEEGKLTISTSPDFPPYESYADDGVTIVGIEVDIMEIIAERLGLEIEWAPMDFDSALLAVQQGKSDVVMSGCTVTEDRLLVMNFTDSYTTAKQVIVVPEGSDITLDTLGDYMIGTQRGTTGFLYTTDDYGEDHVIGYDSYTLVFQALQNGQIDCIVLDDAVGEAYVAELPGLEILDTAYALEDYAFGVDKSNTALTDAMNVVLNELMEDGTVQSIIDSYISE